jgi:hypothetical protein
MAIRYAPAWRGPRHARINLTSVPWEGTYMRNRILRLAILAAVSLGVPAVPSSAQATLPRPLASRPAFEVPNRLLAQRAELGLTAAEAADLAALSAELYSQEKFWHAGSKPWIAAARCPSPQHALDRALATLTPAQRGPAVRALASTEEPAQ